MRVLIAMAASFVLFWMGHAVSCAMHKADFLGRLYPIYNRLMCWSWNVEEWAGIEFMWSPGMHGAEE